MESLQLMRERLTRLPQGDILAALPPTPQNDFGVGWVEGWRGEILLALSLGENREIRRAHPHDPSWQNGPCWSMQLSGISS